LGGGIDLIETRRDQAGVARHERHEWRMHRRLVDPIRQNHVSMFRHGHALSQGKLTLKRFLAASHLLVASLESPYAYVNQLLEKAGIGSNVHFRVPHYTAVPYIVSTSKLVVTVPQKLADSAAQRYR